MPTIYPVVLAIGAVHGFAAVLGGRFENAPHGALCAALLPFVFEANAEHLRALVAGAGSEGQDQDQGRGDEEKGAAAATDAAEATVRTVFLEGYRPELS